ncbi:GAF and ANTAR domain-containing protein [Amycolatopsis sp. NPDC049252]|uniref:GAF and ANTAR domain-containing protein n=1 Tax=Amycolatopsis sp. NPDC049252 TaxID=3363933 RepID=UPI003720AAFB
MHHAGGAREHDWAADRAAFAEGDGRVEPGPLAGQFAALTARLLDAVTVGEVLEQVVAAAREVIPGADLVSVTLRSPDGTFFTPVETDPVATQLDQVQYETGEGPCLEASREDGPGHIRSKDIASEPAWPRFGPRAAEHGYTAVLSTALQPFDVPPRQGGALNVYARRGEAFDERARDAALLLATHASLALAGVTARTRAGLQAENLRRAVDSRDVIGQAKGILMQRRGIDADEAFDLLRRTSQELNVKLAELAGTLAARHREIDLPRGG